MRSSGWIVVLLLLLALPVAAQEDSSRNTVVPLAAGGFIAFKSETATIRTSKTGAALPKLQGELIGQAFADENRVIHRVLVDAQGKYLFGYDLTIEPVPASKTFTIGVGPLNAELEKKLLASNAGGPPIATLPQSAEPQILGDGDSFALDLLVNQKTGLKIVDRVKVSFDRSNLWNDSPKALPRDFTLDAVALKVIDYRLSIDGNLVAEGKHGKNLVGALLWCYVEGHGRFIFSLVPRDGYDFQKIGIINENRIEFTLKGKNFQWLSSSPILSSGGTWNIWVLEDPTYVPFGSKEIAKKEKNKLERLDDSIKVVEDKAARIADPASATFRGPANQVNKAEEARRFKVMVGAADRIENLWPRNP
ncbi:MAG TPA: hypothetical protein VMS31_17735 [Pyrinomonadaceae bacterium]|nr:hypothetical protein [Pyrinomonadaceae bacterium]